MFSNNNENSELLQRFVEGQINALWHYSENMTEGIKLTNAKSEIKEIKDPQVLEKLNSLVMVMMEDLKKSSNPQGNMFDDDQGVVPEMQTEEEKQSLAANLALKKGHYFDAVLSSVRLGKEGLLKDTEKEAYIDLLKTAEASIRDPNSDTLAAFDASRQKFEATVKDNKVVRNLSNTFVKAVVASLLIISVSIIGIFPTALLALCLAPTAIKKINAYNAGVESVFEKTNMSNTAKANKGYKGIFDEQKKKGDVVPSVVDSLKKGGADMHAKLLKAWEGRKPSSK